MLIVHSYCYFFFFNDTATTEIYTLSLHDALPISFLIIEHNMELVMRLCSSVLVMAEGGILMEGSPEEIRSDPRLIDAFLGGSTSSSDT